MKKNILIISLLAFTGCKAPNTNFRCLQEKYTREELSLFSEAGFYGQTVRRWKSNIKILPKGDYTKTDLANLDSLIAEIVPLFPFKIERVDQGENITIYFTDTATFPGTLYPTSGCNGQTMSRTKYVFGSEVTSATIWVNPKTKPSFIKRTMRHEFMHALGFDHSITYRNVIMGIREYGSIESYIASGGEDVYHAMSSLDSASIRILYDTCLRAGTKRTDFEKFIKDNGLWVRQKNPIL